MFKKIIAIAATLFVAVGLTVAALAAPASATLPVVTGTYACNSSTGLFDITWKVTGDTGYPNETATIKTQSVATSPTLLEQTVKGSGFVAGVQSGVGTGVFSLTIAVQWTNHSTGNLVSKTGSVTIPSGAACATPADASASVSTTPANCAAAELLVLGVATNATWGPVTGSYSVTATANSGHTFPGGLTTQTFTGTLAAQLSATDPLCIKKAVPVSPDVTTVTTCGEYGSVTPKSTEGVDYALEFDKQTGAYTVTATPQTGYYFDGDADQVITFVGNVGEFWACVIEPDASIAYGDCKYGELADDRAVSITFDNTNSNTAVEFVVEGFPAYTATVGAGATFTFAVDDAPMSGGTYTVVASGETFVLLIEACPEQPDPETREVVTYKYDCAADEVTVTTTTFTTEYVFDDDEWVLGDEVAGEPVITTRALTEDERFEECGVYIGTDPTASACDALTDDTLRTSWIKVDTDPRVIYTITNDVTDASVIASSVYTELDAGEYTVTAVAATGYVLKPTAEQVWHLTVEDTSDCLPPLALVTPTFSSTQPTCAGASSYTIGELVPGTIAWFVNGNAKPAGTYYVNSAQTIELVAEPLSDADGLAPNWRNPGRVAFAAPTLGCQLPTLALTGVVQSFGLIWVGLLLALTGVGLVLARKKTVTHK